MKVDRHSFNDSDLNIMLRGLAQLLRSEHAKLSEEKSPPESRLVEYSKIHDLFYRLQDIAGGLIRSPWDD